MAAVEPPESAKRQDSCPDEVESVDMSGPLSSEDILKPKGETTHSKTAEKPEHAQRGTAPTDGAAFTSHSEVGVESRAASTTCKSPDNHDAEADKNACHNTACGKELRCLDWSETDDNSEDIPTHLKHKRGMLMHRIKFTAMNFVLFNTVRRSYYNVLKLLDLRFGILGGVVGSSFCLL